MPTPRWLIGTCSYLLVDRSGHPTTLSCNTWWEVGWRSTKNNMIAIWNQCPRRDDWSGQAHTCLIELDILQHIHATHDAQVGWRSTKNNMITILNQCPRRAPTPVIRLDSGIARAIFCLPEPLYSELVAMDRQTNALYGFFWCFAWRICHVLMMLRKLLQTRAATDAMVIS